MEREFYSIPEAAARLGISRIAVFKRVKKGQLAALRFGRNWAVPAAALELAATPGSPSSPAAPERKPGRIPPSRPPAPAPPKKGAGAIPPPGPGEEPAPLGDELL